MMRDLFDPTDQDGGDPAPRSLAEARRLAAGCTRCDLYRNATQTVFGEGPISARIMLVGEQPGDQEDLQGKPFVGPAGKLLDRALLEAGIDRRAVYLTNAVKHFKFERRGKRRIHAKPSAAQVHACRPWLEAELTTVKPRVVLALGATAAQALFGRTFRVTQRRGQVFESPWSPRSMATVHPSSILRAPDDTSRHAAYAAFVSDLRAAAVAVAHVP
jgi:DNA polymerase